MHERHDHQADFTTLWVRVQPLVTSYVFSSVRQTQNAEDVVQEVALAALAAFDKYDPARPFLPWVLGIAKFRVLNYYRTSADDRLTFDDAALSALAEAHESLQDSVGDRYHALDECLKQLDDRKLQVLELRYGKDIAVASIAKEIASTPNAVSLLLHKARKALSECIRRRLRAGRTGDG